MTINYATLPDAEAAQSITGYLQAEDAEAPLRYARIGIMCDAVYKRLLWQHIIDPASGQPCHSFARWVRVASPHAYSTCYAAMEDIRSLSDVPADDLAQIRQSNFATMKQLSTAVRRDPTILEAAKSMRTEKFVEAVNLKHPGQALEGRSRIYLNATAGQKAVILEAIEVAIRTGYAASAAEVVEGWAAEFMQGQGEPVAAQAVMIQ
jgi:hypothetical protein